VPFKLSIVGARNARHSDRYRRAKFANVVRDSYAMIIGRRTESGSSSYDSISNAVVRVTKAVPQVAGRRRLDRTMSFIYERDWNRAGD